MKRDSLREKVEKPSKAAWVLKLLDEEEGSETGGAVKDQPKPTPQAQVAIEESVEVIEAPPVKKRKLTKIAGTEVPAAGTVAPITEAVDVAGFLTSRRKKVVPPSVPPLAEVEKFMANEPVLAVPVAVAQMVGEEPLQAPEGSIPTLSHPLGSNIRHILEEIDMMSEDSVGMADDNMEAPPKAVTRTLRKTLSTIPEAGNSSRAPTPKGSRSPTLAGVKKEVDSRRSQASKASEASSSESTAEIQPEGATWTVGRRLAKLGGDFKGNPPLKPWWISSTMRGSN
jgi:hypothetical protein